jgi:hypothetical protein
MSEKKPDYVAWDEKNQKYHANILPYGSNVGAPAIKKDNISGFKELQVNKLQKKFNSRYKELVDEYNNLVEEVKLNQLIYSSDFSFEPVIGEIYHLYYGNNGRYFLSLIHPKEWNREHIVSVVLNSEHRWVSIKE